MILARKITAVDPDISDKSGVKLELHGKDSDKFKLNPGNGDVYLATDTLDREEKKRLKCLRLCKRQVRLLVKLGKLTFGNEHSV